VPLRAYRHTVPAATRLSLQLLSEPSQLRCARNHIARPSHEQLTNPRCHTDQQLVDIACLNGNTHLYTHTRTTKTNNNWCTVGDEFTLKTTQLCAVALLALHASVSTCTHMRTRTICTTPSPHTGTALGGAVIGVGGTGVGAGEGACDVMASGIVNSIP
jgi:hypothetical protein